MDNNYYLNENRGNNKNKKKSFDFNTCKKNTIKSLNEIECFLNNFHDVFRYIKLYKILK